MSDTAKALGIPSLSFDYQGKSYPLHPLGMWVRGEYEAYLEKRAYNRVRRLRPTMSEDEYQQQRRETGIDIDKGVYRFWGEVSLATLRDIPECWEYFCLLRVRFGLPENERRSLTPAFMEEMSIEDKQRLSDLLNSIDAPAEMNGEANPIRPVSPASPT
jgi:hypothetical protein